MEENNEENVEAEIEEVELMSAGIVETDNAFHSGANWFYWIAALSVVNSVIMLVGAEWGFILGLGITQIFDGIAIALTEDSESEGVAFGVRAVVFCIDLVVAFVFALFGWLANRRHGWAFIVGMVLYAMDGLIFLLIQDWLGVGFHGFALFCIFAGYSAMKKLPAETKI